MIPQAIFKKIKQLPKKILIPAVIVLLAIGFIINRNSQPQKLEFTDVKRVDIKQIISASGTLTGKDSASLRFIKGGRLAYLSVKAGDRVYQGQTIAGLDVQDLSIALQQAQNNLRDKQASLDKILDDIHLFQYGMGGFENIGSQNETATQRQLRIAAQVARDNTYDSVQAAKRNFQDTFISTPFAGLVTQTNVVPEQTVGPSDIVVQIVDDTQILFDAEVDEADSGKISVGQEAEITLDAYPDQISKGRVEQILPQTKITSVGTTVVIARILLDLNIKPAFGLTGQASVITNRVNNVLSIPQEALREDNSAVIQTPRGLEAIKVEPGLRSDVDVEIKSGLHEEQKVVLNPPAHLPQKFYNSLLRIFRFNGRDR